MPTENRSSNTEMVNVPRERLHQFIEYSASVCKSPAWVKDKAALLAALEQPAPQPHPDPIAWMVGTAFWWTKEEAERDAAETGLPIVGLGPISGVAPAEQRQGEPVTWEAAERISNLPAVHEVLQLFSEDPTGDAGTSLVREVLNSAHSDPGEVERLRANAGQHKLEMDAACGELDILRAQLAEAQALLREIHDGALSGFARYSKIEEFLSASAEPSAPTWSCQACKVEQPTDRACDACGGKTALIAAKF